MANKESNTDKSGAAAEVPHASRGGDAPDPTPAMDAIRGTLTEFLGTASVDRVYGLPVREGDVVMIPAAEVLVGLGFGMGFGGGVGPAHGDGEGEKSGDQSGSGGGGGGCGRTLSRPVAVVIVSRDGVRVEPIVDVTKIAIAAITAAGFMLATMMGILSPRQMVKQIRGE